MSRKYTLKPLTIALGATFAASLGTAAADTSKTDTDNPFSMTSLSSGYMVADIGEGKCGEGKCGEGKKKGEEGKCGEGKKGKEGKCGEGKCGEGKKGKEGKCGEGKCGEGKKKGEEGRCGGNS